LRSVRSFTMVLYHSEMSSTASSPLDWERIDTVLVDMDGTLLDLAFDNFFWLELVPSTYAELHGLALEEARGRLAEHFTAWAGKLEWYCLDHWSGLLGLDLKVLKREHGHRVRFLPGALEFLAAVRARGKAVWIVTNAHWDTLAVKAQRTGVDRLVDRVVISHDLKAPKESAEFWLELHRRHPFERARALLIEDSVPVLAAARAFGLGYTVAIRRPDSTLPSRSITAYAAVEGVAELL
jgi:GMP/IMP 5'-nucleotidase